MEPSRLKQRVMAVLWPSFLMAGVLEMLVFVVVDPMSLHWFDGEPLPLSRNGVYSVTFLIFWVVIAASGAMSQLLSCSASEINVEGRQGTSAQA